MTRPQGTRAAQPLAGNSALLKRGAHVNELEHESRCAEHMPGSVALERRTWVSGADDENRGRREQC
jgi:hypothetical protein